MRGMEGGREGGREEGRGMEGGREGGRSEGRGGRRDGGKEGGQGFICPALTLAVMCMSRVAATGAMAWQYLVLGSYRA